MDDVYSGHWKVCEKLRNTHEDFHMIFEINIDRWHRFFHNNLIIVGHSNLIIVGKVFIWRSGMPQLMNHCYLTLKKPTSLTFPLLSSSWPLFKPRSCWKRSSSCIKDFFIGFWNCLIDCSILAIVIGKQVNLVLAKMLRFLLNTTDFSETPKWYPGHRRK